MDLRPMFITIKKLTQQALFITVCAFLLASCDPGSRIRIELVENTCFVSMTSNSDGFNVEMQLACDEYGENCYTITSLVCQGVEKPDAVPIDLVTSDGCPNANYCIESCSEGLEAPGHLWDIPSLLEVDGCNTYQQ